MCLCPCPRPCPGQFMREKFESFGLQAEIQVVNSLIAFPQKRAPSLQLLETAGHTAIFNACEEHARTGIPLYAYAPFHEFGQRRSDACMSNPKGGQESRIEGLIPPLVCAWAALSEKILPEDPTSDTWLRNHTYHGYSPTGDVTGTGPGHSHLGLA
jgi:hypothetical protein